VLILLGCDKHAEMVQICHDSISADTVVPDAFLGNVDCLFCSETLGPLALREVFIALLLA
jgi:hypothetical protein